MFTQFFLVDELLFLFYFTYRPLLQLTLFIKDDINDVTCTWI